MTAALIGLPIAVGLLGLIVLAAVHVPDKQSPDKDFVLPDRPGADDQWSEDDFHKTVPNIRRTADEELAWWPASRDAPVPTRYRWPWQPTVTSGAAEASTRCGAKHRVP